MDLTFVHAVEKALEAHGSQIAKLHKGLNALAESQLDTTRRAHATDRILLAVAALAAQGEEDPLKWLDKVRHQAMTPLTGEDMAPTREMIELNLAKLEGFILRQGQRGE